MDRAGFGWEALHARHPRLVYTSISGYGQTGPRRDEPGYDAVIQAEGGLMSITGDGDGPAYRLGVAISDIVAGMFAAQGVTAALFARERTGQGQRVDIGMLDTTAALLTYQAGNYFATGQIPARLGNRHPTIAPYETLPTADGEIVIAVGNDGIWKRFCPAIDRPELADDPRFRDEPRPPDQLRRAEARVAADAGHANPCRVDRALPRRERARAAPCAMWRRCSPTRSWPRATWWRRWSTRPPGRRA